MADIVILGAGGHGRELQSYVLDLAHIDPTVRLWGFVDDHLPIGVGEAFTVLCTQEGLRDWALSHGLTRLDYITAVGNNVTRADIVRRVDALGSELMQPYVLKHPAALVGTRVSIGGGTGLAPGCVVTTDVRIGRHCILNVKASVAHDCVLEDYVNLSPGATICGQVHLEEGCFIGAGATVIQGIRIGAWTTIGAGAVVLNDLPAGITAVGIPARRVKPPIC